MTDLPPVKQAAQAPAPARQAQTQSPIQHRMWLIDLLRLLSFFGILMAHVVVVGRIDAYPLWFWLGNDFSAMMFVALVGISATLSSKDNAKDKRLYIHAGAIFLLGMLLSFLTPNIITVLPTLACVMVLLRWLPDNNLTVLLSIALAVISVSIAWSNELSSAYNIDLNSLLWFGLADSVLAFLLTGAYGLTRWLMVAVLARYIWNRRELITDILCASALTILGSVLFFTGSFASQVFYFFLHPLSGYTAAYSRTEIYVSMPDYRDASLLETLSSVHSHGGSVFACVPVLTVVILASVLSCLSDRYVTSSGLSLTETVSSWYYSKTLIDRPRSAFFNLGANCLSLYVVSVLLDNVFVIYDSNVGNYMFACVCCVGLIYTWLLFIKRGPVETLLKKVC